MMVSARAMISPGAWSGRDSSWPRVSLNKFIEPIKGALYDWASDSLELGPLASWQALNRDVSMPADGGSPTVVDSDGFKAVRFNGTTNRMRIQTPDLSVEHTVVSVFRFTNHLPGDVVIYGYNDSVGGSIATHTSIDTLSIYAGAYLTPNPRIPGDNSWHIVIATNNFSNSAFRVDGYEIKGTLPTVKREGITLGYSTRSTTIGDDNRSAIEYRRNLILPALTDVERLALYKKLKAHYKM